MDLTRYTIEFNIQIWVTSKMKFSMAVCEIMLIALILIAQTTEGRNWECRDGTRFVGHFYDNIQKRGGCESTCDRLIGCSAITFNYDNGVCHYYSGRRTEPNWDLTISGGRMKWRSCWVS